MGEFNSLHVNEPNTEPNPTCPTRAPCPPPNASPTQSRNPHGLRHCLQRRRHSHMDLHDRLGFFTCTYEPLVKGMLIYFTLFWFQPSNSLNVRTPYIFLHPYFFSCTSCKPIDVSCVRSNQMTIFNNPSRRSQALQSIKRYFIGSHS
jgi:hypothetical protein